MAKIDGNIEWLVDEYTGRVVGHKLPDGNEVGVVTADVDHVTGRITIQGVALNGNADVVVYGANPGGIAAAIHSAREGARTIIIEPTEWIGGMVTSGLSATDVNEQRCSATVVGFAKEFYKRAQKYYGTTSRWQIYWTGGLRLEPQVAETIIRAMLNEAGVTVITGCELVSVKKTGTRITSATFEGLGELAAPCWIDATYEGDLIAAAGCSVAIGREANATYTETDNGRAPLLTDSTQFHTSVSPYVIDGDSGSGLLPGIYSGTLPAEGAASPYVQALCYRINLTKDVSILTAIPEPASYNPLDFELLGRHAALAGTGWTTLADIITFFQYTPGAPLKYDVLHRAPVSIDYISTESTEYITANRARRTQIEQNAKNHILGLIKFCKTDTRIPAAVRADAALYGFCSDQWQQYGGFPPRPYIRVGRRLVGDFVLKDSDIKAANLFTDYIAFSYYGLDSHHCTRYVSGGAVKNEGKRMGGTYVGAIIPYRVTLPKVAECTNLLSTFAVSASYAAHCSIRMEPISMAIGHACGIAAAWAAKTGKNVQDMDLVYLRAKQDIKGVYKADGGVVAVTTFADGTVTETGAWTDVNPDSNNFIVVGTKGRQSSAAGATVAFAPSIRQNGPHKVWIKWPDDGSVARSTVVPVTITHAGGTTTFTVNQNGGTGDGGDWFYAGEYVFAKGSPSTHKVTIGTDGTNSTVVNAIKVIPA